MRFACDRNEGRSLCEEVGGAGGGGRPKRRRVKGVIELLDEIELDHDDERQRFRFISRHFAQTINYSSIVGKLDAASGRCTLRLGISALTIADKKSHRPQLFTNTDIQKIIPAALVKEEYFKNGRHSHPTPNMP